MLHKLILPILLLGLSSGLYSQVGYYSGSLSYGLAYHGAYKVFDEGGRIGLTTNKYLWDLGVNPTSKFSLASSYHFNKMRLEANYSYFSGLNITSGWVEPYANFELLTRNIEVTAANLSFVAYINNARSNALFKFSPGIGLGVHKLDIFGGGQLRAAARFSELISPNDYRYLDVFLDKFNYQLIGALEANVRIGSKTYLFLNSMYQLGFLKMYQRDIEYITSVNTEASYKARLQYNGNNYNFNLGLRWHFGDAVGYNIVE